MGHAALPLVSFLSELAMWSLPFILDVSVTMVDAARARVALLDPKAICAPLPERAETLRGIPTQDEILTMGYLQSKHAHVRVVLRLWQRVTLGGMVRADRRGKCQPGELEPVLTDDRYVIRHVDKVGIDNDQRVQ